MKVKMVKCDQCNFEVPNWCTIDTWAIIDNKNYCMKCQKVNKTGWFEHNK